MLKIYCDGACSGNPGPGGWAFVIPELDNFEKSGFQVDTTNNRMEITAVVEALKHLYENNIVDKNIEIITDSQYVINTMTKCWKKNKNSDLWATLDYYKYYFDIKWTWVKGHSTNEYNQRCDELAVAEYKKNSLIKVKELPLSDDEKSNYAIEVTFRVVKKFEVNNSVYRMYHCQTFKPDFYILDRNEQCVEFTGTEEECLSYLKKL